MKHTALGIYYLLLPNNIVIDMFGNEIEPKVHKGNKFIIQNRKTNFYFKTTKIHYIRFSKF